MSLVLDIEKRAGDFHLRCDISCGDEVLGLLGASGCGKSMTLQCIAGIQKPDSGRILIDGRTVFDEKTNLSPQKRHTGLLFQNYALFPNMTIRQNIRMGAKRDQADRDAVDRMLERFRLTDVAGLYPLQVSGGQQQRAALARMLISKPDILLLDEPFSALDAHLRFRVEEELRSVIREFQKTVILVSHNRDEVFRLAQKVAVMKDGRVDVFGTKEEIFSDPKTRNAASLTGCKNISQIRILDTHRFEATQWGLIFTADEIPPDARYVGIRMHYIRMGNGENAFLCDVAEEIENPFSYTLMLKRSGAEGETEAFGYELEKADWIRGRKQITVHFPPGIFHFLKE